MSTLGEIQRLSDDELYAQLKKANVDRPVNASTRKVLEKRLAKLRGIDVQDSSRGGNDSEFSDEVLDDGNSEGDVVRRRGHRGHDTFGNSFYVEEVDTRPSEQLRARRASELEHLQEHLQEQEEINKKLGALEPEGGSGSRTALIVLSILVVIAVFLLISYMTEGESADEIIRIPQAKVAPSVQANKPLVNAEDPPV